jgi:hypothetical protein
MCFGFNHVASTVGPPVRLFEASTEKLTTVRVSKKSAPASYMGGASIPLPGGSMRTLVLLPFAAVAAVLAGCGSQGREHAARSVPQRDLTLAAQAHQVEIASPVELGSLRTQSRTVRPSRTPRPRSAQRSSAVVAKPAPAAVTTGPVVVLASAPVVEPASTAPEAANDRELLPGKTVTLIPASSGPSTTPEWTDEGPPARGRTMVVGGGGRCPGRGRGPGIGIATGPRPDFR